jgi:hypothetical protein
VDETHARVIAEAIARTGVHHRRNGLAAGVAALLGCGLTIYVDLASQKAVSLALTIFCAVASYRSIRLANRYVDPSASPVLAALASDRSLIVRVALEPPPRSFVARLLGGLIPDDGAVWVAVDHERGDRLWLRIEATSADERLPMLFDAFAEVTPKAEIRRQLPPSG